MNTKSKKILIYTLAAMLILSLIMQFENKTIFTVSHSQPDWYNKSDSNSFVVSYSMSRRTSDGTGWVIKNAANEYLIDRSAILQTDFDPRLINQNKDLSLDNLATYYITAEKVTEVIYKDEKVVKIYPQKITVCHNRINGNTLKVHDMSIKGQVRGILGFAVKIFHISS